MRKSDWKDRMNALLKKKGWDIKDWRRATGLNQWQLESLMEMDLSEMNEEDLESIYEQAKKAKLDKNLMRFDCPVMIAVWAHKGGMGKSTVVTNLSYELAKRGYNVLAIDTDSQSDMTSVLFPDYLEQLNRTLGKLDIPFQTGSTVVDSLLSMKYHEICEKLPHINFEAENLIFPKSCRIQPTDLCIILGNALDNAIEACERLAADSRGSECFIRLSSLCRKEALLLTVENSFNGELKIGQGSVFPSTTKPDSNAHGIGMHNIRAAAQRYQGGVSWEAKEHQFTLTVMLANGDFDINASAGPPPD